MAITLAGLAFTALPVTAESSASDAWAFTVTPYLWLPTINGSLKYDLPSFNTNTDVEPAPTST